MGLGRKRYYKAVAFIQRSNPFFFSYTRLLFDVCCAPTFIHMILSLKQTDPCLSTRVKSTIRLHVPINTAIMWNCACVLVYFPWVPLILLQVPWWPRPGLYCWSLVFKGKNFLPSR